MGIKQEDMSIVQKEKRQPAKKICYKYWAIPEKKPNRGKGEGGLRIWDFLGY